MKKEKRQQFTVMNLKKEEKKRERE